MLWRVFAASAISTFMLSVCAALYEGSVVSLTDSAALKFGTLDDGNFNTFLDLPAAIIIGIVCGLLGAFFIYVNVNLAVLRKRYITQNWQKLLEASLFAFATASVFFGAVALQRNSCETVPQNVGEENNLVQFTC